MFLNLYILRTTVVTAVLVLLFACSTAPKPTLTEVGIYSAGQGSGFLPYAQGVAAYLSANGLKAQALESRGSIENLQKLELETNRLGTVFLGTVFEAVNGSAPWTNGKKHTSLRSLFPMYETSFQIVTLRAANITMLSQLAGKRVGFGPAGGPAESFFKGLAEAASLQVQTVAGTPAALLADLQAGKIDALWQGASLPIPAIKLVADASDAVVFGLNDAEVAAMHKRFPFLSPSTVAPNMYRVQATPVKSVAACNFVMAHKDLPDADAYFITKTILAAADPKAMHASAAPTRTANASNNTAVPFHPGALWFYKEQGVEGLK